MELSAVFNITIMILFGIIGYLYKRNEDRLKEIELEAKEIKTNYLSRFEMINKNINELKIEILEAVNELKIEIIESKNDQDK